MKKRFVFRRMLSAALILGALTLTACSGKKETDPNAQNKEVIEMMKNACGVAVTELDTITEESLKTLKEAGVAFVKVHVPYPLDAAGKVAPGYLEVKRVIKLIRECGLEPVCQSFTPGGNAYNSATGRVEWVSYLPAVYEDYEDEYFYKMVLQGAEYIGRDLKEYADCWIISNEPNLTVFTGPLSFSQIARYISTCAEGIKKQNPKAYCGVNIFGSADKNRAMALLPELYGEDSNLDYLGLDSYFGTLVAGGAEDWDEYIDTYYEMVHVPIMITEFSYSSYVYEEGQRENDSQGLQYNSPVCRDKRFSFEWEGHTRNEQTQVEYAKACLDIFKKHEEVIGWCWFSNIDKAGACWECGDTNCPMESSWGLLRSDGTAKPVLDVIGQ